MERLYKYLEYCGKRCNDFFDAYQKNDIQPPEPQKLITKKIQKNLSFSLTVNALHVNIPTATNKRHPKYDETLLHRILGNDDPPYGTSHRCPFQLSAE